MNRTVLIFIVVITILVQKNATYAESYINLNDITIAYNNEEFSKAIRAYKKLADNGNIEGYLNLAVIFKDLGHYSRAIEILNKGYLRFRDDLRIMSLLGRLYYLNNQPDEAIAILKKVSILKPDDLNVYINLGLCFEDKGDDAEAQKYFDKVISLDKNNIVARLSLAELYYRKDSLSEAANEYKIIGLMDRSLIKIQKILGEIFFKLGNFEESLKIFRKVRFIDSEDKLIEQRINEINVKLGKEYFEKEKQRIALQRKKRAVFVLPFPKIKNMVFVRVGLMQGENSVEFKSSAPFEIKTKNGELFVASGLEGEDYLLSKNTDGKIIISNKDNEKIIVDEPIVIKPTKPEGTITLFNVKLGQDNFWANQQDRSYLGSIEINTSDIGINVINVISLEEYLYSVVPSEMPHHWPKEALKAQAVTARTEAMAKLGRHKNEGFDFCSEVHCQVCRGVEQEIEVTSQAVDETRGIIMTYSGKPVDALYSSNCGGHTQENIFGDGQSIPYLVAKFDALEKYNVSFPLSPIELEYWFKEPPKGILCDIQESLRNSNFRWARIYTFSEINQMLNKLSDVGEVSKIIVLKRQKSGHISVLKIVGENSSYVLEKELNIRKTLGNLRSSMFKVEVKYGPDKKPEKFIFYGGGFGHGVGMCQSGAYGLANKGKNYKEILKHYYQGIDFKKIY